MMRRFNTIEGVFTPCLLSILGVIMYLRLGWVVGQVGLGGALLIILFANIISLATALSMSSIVTNIRIGTGGAHSIIAKSLGVEAGGAIGIPLYLSQAISVAFYITGFTECWESIFPNHDTLLVSLCVWLVILAVSYISTKLAFRIQYVIVAIICLSLVSIFSVQGRLESAPAFWNSASIGNFWEVFAIFFPAVTGILTGAAISGELKDPRKSIPRGTIWAIAVSFVVYVLLATWCAFNATPVELVTNKSILIDAGRWKFLVIGGIMGATLSSALAMSVGSPRTLLALGKHAIIPFSKSFSRINKRGEPTPAVLLTALIALTTLLFGTLDTVANLLTMIFLITYGMINLSVFIEQSIGIASFRPTFRISRFISFLGSLSCFAVMLTINPQFSMVAIFIIIAIYIILLRREVKVHSPDVRSGLLVFMAEQFAKAAARLPYHPKIWKPNLLVPVIDFEMFIRIIPFIKSIVAPTGRIFCFKVVERDIIPSTLFVQEEEGSSQGKVSANADIKEKLEKIIHPLKEEGLFVETSVVESPDRFVGDIAVMQTVTEMLFPPNTLFYVLGDDKDDDQEVIYFIKKTTQEGLGVMTLKYHEKLGFSQEKVINLWIRRQSPNLDLSILTALQLKNNWDGHVRIIQSVRTQEEVADASNYLNRIKKIMRLPLDIDSEVLVGDFRAVIFEAPAADINIFGMPDEPDLQLVRDVFEAIQTSVLFLRDSKHESAMA